MAPDMIFGLDQILNLVNTCLKVKPREILRLPNPVRSDPGRSQPGPHQIDSLFAAMVFSMTFHSFHAS